MFLKGTVVAGSFRVVPTRPTGNDGFDSASNSASPGLDRSPLAAFCAPGKMEVSSFFEIFEGGGKVERRSVEVHHCGSTGGVHGAWYTEPSRAKKELSILEPRMDLRKRTSQGNL